MPMGIVDIDRSYKVGDASKIQELPFIIIAESFQRFQETEVKKKQNKF